MARNVTRAANALAITRRPVGDRNELPTVITQDGLANLITGMGTMKDKRTFSGYGPVRRLQRYELENMWESSWLAKRIVGNPAEDMTREWRDFKFADDEKSPNIEALEKAEVDLCVKERFFEGNLWGDLYGGAIMILGIRNTPNMSVPFDVTTTRLGDLQYIQVIDRHRCSPMGTVTDLTSPSFGLPEFYQLAESSVMVHHTRIIRFDGDKLPYFPWTANGRWHASKLQVVYDTLMNCDQTTVNIATMMFEANVDVIKKENLDTMLSSAENEAKLMKRYSLAGLMKGLYKMLLIDGSETYEKKATNFTNLDVILRKFEDHVCGASGQPRTRLWGESPGGLGSNGDGEIRNWYDKIRSEQMTKQGPKINYFDQVFVRSVLGAYPDDFSYEWNSLWQISDSEQSLMDFQRAQTDQIYLQNEVVDAGVVAGALKQRNTYPNMTNVDVDMATDLAKEKREAPPLPAPTAGNVPPTPAKSAAKKTPAKKVASKKVN